MFGETEVTASQEEIMWTALFSVAFAIAVALSVVVLVMQSDGIRYP
jgi:hypothetical protein